VPDTSLPLHLISLPPPSAYPQVAPGFSHPKLERGLPRWVLPAAIAVVASIAIGVIAAVAG
jgi:hypothetical protein